MGGMHAAPAGSTPRTWPGSVTAMLSLRAGRGRLGMTLFFFKISPTVTPDFFGSEELGAALEEEGESMSRLAILAPDVPAMAEAKPDLPKRSDVWCTVTMGVSASPWCKRRCVCTRELSAAP